MYFRPSYPIGKNQFVKSTLGLVAIILRKSLPLKKEKGEFYSEGEYIVMAREAIDKEFSHLVERLGLAKKEEKKDVIRKEDNKNTD